MQIGKKEAYYKLKEKKITGFDYLWVALYACAVFAFELLISIIEGKMGVDFSAATTTQMICHWIMTTVGWSLLGLLVLWIGKKTTDFDILEKTEPLGIKQYLLVLFCFVISIIATYFDWGGYKPYIEFMNLGALKFVVQYIYYIAEGFIISIVIVYGQEACEKWFHNDKIAFGGIILGLVWGLAHIFTKGSIQVGLLAAFSAFVMGASYVFVNKDYRKALPIIILLFVM